MITVQGDTAVSDTGFTLRVTKVDPYDPQHSPRIEYQEGERVLKGGLESQWSLKVLVSWEWEPPYGQELITADRREQIQENIIAALDSLGHYYYSF
jgi:hypothetical protein